MGHSRPQRPSAHGPDDPNAVDDAGGSTYWLSKDGAFVAGSIYTQAPNDSGVTNFVGTVAPSTGFITPIAIGFTKTTGMVFVPND
jgi:hypothetical protein